MSRPRGTCWIFLRIPGPAALLLVACSSTPAAVPAADAVAPGADAVRDAVGDPAADPLADAARDLTGDPAADAAADPVAEASPDAVADVAADSPPDAAALWGDLAGSGLLLNGLAGVASEMSTSAAPNADRDFEYQQYKPYPGFRMRNGHRFNDVEPSRGVWDFDAVSGSVDGAAAVGSKVLMGLDYSQQWAQDGPDSGSVDIADFAEYAGTMAGHFCETVKDYEVWNEENLTIFWAPAPDPARYADLLAACYTAIHAACPDARVIFGGMSSYDDVAILDTWNFLRRALAAHPGLCDAFDGVGLHPYTFLQYDPPEHDEVVSAGQSKNSQTAMVRIARDILQQGGCDPKPIFFTEVGWPTLDLGNDPVARYAVRSFLLAAKDDIQAWCWYTFWDMPPNSSSLRPEEDWFGFFEWPGPDDSVRTPKPAWLALTALLDRFGGYRFARDLGPALGLPDDVYALAFADDAGRVVAALWDGREDPDIDAAGNVGPGGPDTTYALDLPLPACTGPVTLLDQSGHALPAPAAGATAHLVLTTTVQYLDPGCGTPP